MADVLPIHHKKGTKVERRKTEEINKFRLQYIYTCKCHKATPCVTILSTQICIFFLLQNWRTGGWNRCCLVGEIVLMGMGGREEKTVGGWIWHKYCVHTYVNGKNEICWNYSMGGDG
jgi:hypothetical protein